MEIIYTFYFFCLFEKVIKKLLTLCYWAGAIIVMKEDGRTYDFTGYVFSHNYTLPKIINKFDV